MKINTLINTLIDAQNYVSERGVADWEWEHSVYTNYEIIKELLPEFLYKNSADFYDFDDCLREFIITELRQNPKDYNL